MCLPKLCIAIGTGSCTTEDSKKVDCGHVGITQPECESQKCCWKESNVPGVPYCFHKVGESEVQVTQ